jgi:uncharacterized protein
MPPFHLAFPVTDIEETKHFYGNILECGQGRCSARWVDFNFFGHQISAHLSKPEENTSTNHVDGDNVPVRHFGAILDWANWEKLITRIESFNIQFRIEPRIRFKGKLGEQGTFFIDDPSGNCLEFKTFRKMESIFAT